jgi:hypothetical protein
MIPRKTAQRMVSGMRRHERQGNQNFPSIATRQPRQVFELPYEEFLDWEPLGSSERLAVLLCHGITYNVGWRFNSAKNVPLTAIDASNIFNAKVPTWDSRVLLYKMEYF